MLSHLNRNQQARSQAQKGPRQPKLIQRVKDAATAWLSQEITWYAGQQLKMDLMTGVASWHRDGEDPLPLLSRPLTQS